MNISDQPIRLNQALSEALDGLILDVWPNSSVTSSSPTGHFGLGALRAGIDVIAVAEIADSVHRHGDRYLQRVYSPRELNDSTGPSQVSAASLAARFAAKEATIKALQPDEMAIDWRAIEVRRGHQGAPSLHLEGDILEVARRANVIELALTLVHEGGLAAALVVARCAGNEGIAKLDRDVPADSLIGRDVVEIGTKSRRRCAIRSHQESKNRSWREEERWRR